SATDNESEANELTWFVSDPENGHTEYHQNGNQLSFSYSPDSNYSGLDYFSIVVRDDGGAQNSLSQQVTIPVSINVTQLDDAPFFASSPPTDSNLPDVISWNDEEDYIYEIVVVDSDWPWQGYPEIQLRSSLPIWAKWNDLGQGRALLSGAPKWFDEGNYSFSIEAFSGEDLIRQDFTLVIRVDDYPPRIKNSLGKDINNAVQVFIVEDDHRGEVNDAVLGLRAFNPDKEPGDSLGWRILLQPSSGAIISNLDSIEEGEFTMISTFDYFPPLHFNGIDRFVLVADEGDRFTYVPFEVHVKSVQDPPVFTSNSPFEITSSSGKYFEKQINAYDPDKQLINYKLLYPSGDTKWLQIKSQTNDSNGSTVTIGGVVPWESSSGSYTLIASDPSGRFSLLNIQLVDD
ncbi:Ig-like domain-containing protein, partial [Candidatus Chordibacter forsetii]|uniref:Ig-like domain-containing protein n=1 Tax=Candidatus Chordibacter forsetii TaxID=3381758 RepID=UPI00389A3E71